MGGDFNYAKSVYYQVFLTDSKEVIQNMIHGIIYGKWTFVKRGENFGIKGEDIAKDHFDNIITIELYR